jgi:hypothetical protein
MSPHPTPTLPPPPPPSPTPPYPHPHCSPTPPPPLPHPTPPPPPLLPHPSNGYFAPPSKKDHSIHTLVFLLHELHLVCELYLGYCELLGYYPLISECVLCAFIRDWVASLRMTLMGVTLPHHLGCEWKEKESASWAPAFVSVWFWIRGAFDQISKFLLLYFLWDVISNTQTLTHNNLFLLWLDFVGYFIDMTRLRHNLSSMTI